MFNPWFPKKSHEPHTNPIFFCAYDRICNDLKIDEWQRYQPGQREWVWAQCSKTTALNKLGDLVKDGRWNKWHTKHADMISQRSMFMKANCDLELRRTPVSNEHGQRPIAATT